MYLRETLQFTPPPQKKNHYSSISQTGVRLLRRYRGIPSSLKQDFKSNLSNYGHDLKTKWSSRTFLLHFLDHPPFLPFLLEKCAVYPNRKKVKVIHTALCICNPGQMLAGLYHRLPGSQEPSEGNNRTENLNHPSSMFTTKRFSISPHKPKFKITWNVAKSSGGLVAKYLTLEIPWTAARQAPLSIGILGKNTGVGWHFLLQGYSPPRYRTQVSCIAGRFFTNWATREAKSRAALNEVYCVPHF